QRVSLHLILLPQALLGAITSTEVPATDTPKKPGRKNLQEHRESRKDLLRCLTCSQVVSTLDQPGDLDAPAEPIARQAMQQWPGVTKANVARTPAAVQRGGGQGVWSGGATEPGRPGFVPKSRPARFNWGSRRPATRTRTRW